MNRYTLGHYVEAYITTRKDGNMAYHTGDDLAVITHNRIRVLGQMGVLFNHLTCGQTTHGTGFYHVVETIVGKGHQSHEDALTDCDALYTRLKGVPLMIFHADCVPILFYCQKQGIVGVIHSGREGTRKQIIKHVFNHLYQYENVTSEELSVIVGPSICKKHYEVSRSIIDSFDFDITSYYDDIEGHYYLDVVGICLKQLSELSIKNIKHINVCTYSSDEYDSYRKNNTKNRNASFVFIR